MKVVTGLILLLVNVRLSSSCYGDGQSLFCTSIPSTFSSGYLSLLMVVKDVGEINSTVFRSGSLSSVTRLTINSAGVTGVAEGAFGSFQSLTTLSLNQNLLTDFSPDWLGRPDLLSELNLTENQIQVLDGSMLNGLVRLTRLGLSRNRIRTVDPNTFSSSTMLAELDLSGNRMTRLPAQVFRSLRSTRVGLSGNPWDCSCGAEDFVDFLKDLHRRSLLDRPMQVTCDAPPSLRGRPAWNVSVCVTSTPPGPPSVTQPAPPKPTRNLTAGPASTSVKSATAPPSGSTSGTETSVQPKLTDPPLTHSATVGTTRPSETNTSVQPKPTQLLTTITAALQSGTFAASVPSPPSVTEISVHPNPSERPPSDTNTVCTLVAVIAVLSVLLIVGFFLAVLHRRKRNSKSVTPGRPEGNRNDSRGDDKCAKHSEERENNIWDSEVGWRRASSGVRAKSANAVLSTSPFCAPGKHPESSQPKDAAEQKLGEESDVKGGIQTENLTKDADETKRSAAGRNLDENPSNPDVVPYLSIGMNQSKPGPDGSSKAQRSQAGGVMGRISTWPPTAVQWQERCKMEEEEEEEDKERSDVFTVWTIKSPDEVKKEEHPSDADEDKKEEKCLEMTESGPSQSQKPDDKTTSPSEALSHPDTEPEEQLKDKTQNLNQETPGSTQDLKSADNPEHKTAKRSRQTAKQASGRRAETRSSASRAPSGGSSPDGEALLSRSERAFMGLLHEVVQNNGRWTRERWRQTQASKQRRQDRGTEGV